MSGLIDRHLGDRRGLPTSVLDVGSMDVNGSYRNLFDHPDWTYAGLDMEAGSGVDVVAAQPYRWPVPRSSVDVVISGQAFEHIEFPWVSMLEVQRVLRPGGLFLLIVPASGPEHRFPFDCWRFYPDGLRAMARWADLHVVEAVTHWDAAGYPEDSAQWRDSVLVARKPTGKGWRLLTGEGKRWALRGVTTRQAQRRHGSGT